MPKRLISPCLGGVVNGVVIDRSGSTKRVASAVGEGAMCVALVHRVLAEN